MIFIKFSLPPKINDNIYQKEPNISVQCDQRQHNCTSELCVHFTLENNRVRIKHKQNAPDTWEFACKNYC